MEGKKWESSGKVETLKGILVEATCDKWESSGDVKASENIEIKGKKWESNGKVEAKNIDVSFSSCDEWVSSGDVTVEEGIKADSATPAHSTEWKANNGNVKFKRDLIASKLEQLNGKVIAYGNTAQSIKAKKIDELIVNNSGSPPPNINLSCEEARKLILQTGNVLLQENIILISEFNNSNACVFDAMTHQKIVELRPTSTFIMNGEANQDYNGDLTQPASPLKTQFYQLKCLNGGGKELQFTGAISILNSVSTLQDSITLILQGSSHSSKLNVSGTGQIWLNETPPFPKPKKGGKYLHVASGVQIRGGYYRVQYSTYDSLTPKNWIFEEYATIDSTLAINGKDEVCVIFNTSVTRPPDTSLKIVSTSTPPSFSPLTSISVEPYPKGSVATKSDKWIYKFSSAFTPQMLLDKDAVLSLGGSNLDPIFQAEGSDEHPEKHGFISDIGLNLLTNMQAKSTKQITVFDGSKKLPFINTSISLDIPIDSSNVTLYLASKSDKKYWIPPIGTPSLLYWAQKFPISLSSTLLLNVDSSRSTSTQKVFIFPASLSQFKRAKGVEFMLFYGDLPCARLENDKDILSFTLWKFEFHKTALQRGGVSIFNNVINVNRGEESTLEVATKTAGILTIQIMTIEGSIVKTIEDEYKAVGSYSYRWGGVNESGGFVAKGIYFVRIVGAGIDEIRKILVIKD